MASIHVNFEGQGGTFQTQGEMHGPSCELGKEKGKSPAKIPNNATRGFWAKANGGKSAEEDSMDNLLHRKSGELVILRF